MKRLNLVLVLFVTLSACEDSVGREGAGGSAAVGGDAGVGGGAGTGGTADAAGSGGFPGSGGNGGAAGQGGVGGQGGAQACPSRQAPALGGESLTKPPSQPKWNLPVYVTQAPGAAELYVVEQTGRIWVVQNDAALADPFLDLSNVVSSAYEEGLLGLAFHPDYNRSGHPDNGRFFVYYTETGGSLIRDVVAEYERSSADPLRASANEVQRLVDLDDRRSNHNGGMIAFGPDGFLYVAIGDEGGGGDPYDNGQNLDTLFGSILRLDVDAAGNQFAASGNPFSATTNPPGDPRIWHYGLRNPWRFSFDRQTNDMYIGDVGQDAWEEINFAEAGTWANFGWSAYEGNQSYSNQDIPTPVTFPIRAISHSTDPIVGRGNSVTGGYVYRGNDIAGLRGFYLYADFSGGNVGAFEHIDGQVCNDQPISELSDSQVSSFGEDNDGELYITYLQSGEVSRIIAAP